MSTADDRQRNLIASAGQLYEFNRSIGKSGDVTLFSEDFDWLEKRGAITKSNNQYWLDGFIGVRRGDRKRKPRKRRPPQALL